MHRNRAKERKRATEGGKSKINHDCDCLICAGVWCCCCCCYFGCAAESSIPLSLFCVSTISENIQVQSHKSKAMYVCVWQPKCTIKLKRSGNLIIFRVCVCARDFVVRCAHSINIFI